MRTKLVTLTPEQYERFDPARWTLDKREYRVSEWSRMGIYYHRGPKILVRLRLAPLPKPKSTP